MPHALILRPDILRGSIFHSKEGMDPIVEEFDKKAKRTFSPGDSAITLKVGSHHDNDPEHGITKGRLEVKG